jgi:hypothetical protein
MKRTYLVKTRVIAVFLIAFGSCAISNPAPALPKDAGRASVGSYLPAIFVSILPEIKAKTSMAVLLPTELPRPFGDAKHVKLEVAPDEYAVALYYELDVGNAGFAALFAAKNNATYSLREIGNVREVKLAGGKVGFFRSVSCGGSCAPANLWWEQGRTQYQVQLVLVSTLREKQQQRIITAVANSAILAGPR